MRVFFDTNILLYAAGDDPVRSETARSLLRAGGAISVQVLNEFVAVARRKLRLAWPDISEALSAVRALPLDVRPLTFEQHDLALGLAADHRLNIYDALIVAAALDARCGRLFSEDLQDGRRFGGLTVINPFGAAS